jgi:choline dehydrogenase-like flavoprotein
VRCDRFDGFPCLADGKADAHVLCVRPALKFPNVTLKTRHKVERLDTDAGGRTVTGVVTDKGTFTADVVVVSCGAVNSAALLLKSGLANSSGVVGRHYMCHINSAVIAVSREPNPTKFQKTLGVNDYYYDSGDPAFDHPLGHIQMLAKSDKWVLKAGAPWFAPGHVLDYMARHAVDFWLTSEDLPIPGNRVTVERDGRIRLSYADTNLEPHRRLLKKLRSLLGHLGMHPHLIPHEVVRDARIPLAGVAHQCGTVRFGDDPTTSALDVNCKAHDLDNLYVVDTSFFPSAAAVNPALTAMANALRVGDHLIDRLGAHVAPRLEMETVR